MRIARAQVFRLPPSQTEQYEYEYVSPRYLSFRICHTQVSSGKLAVSGYYEVSSLRSTDQVASIIRILTRPCITLSVFILGFSLIVQALLDSGASLNLIHEDLVRVLGLVTSANNSNLPFIPVLKVFSKV